ncbi:MAG: ExbD/TolR family protein [Pseudomonadota bacterium]
MGAALGAGGSEKPGGRSRRRRRSQPMSEINVTPFVDVMLVLLIIFMVAAPLLATGVQVELPQTEAASLPQEQEEPLLVSVRADGAIFIQTTEVDLVGLLPKLSAIRQARGEGGGKVFFRADANLRHGYVQQVLALVRNAQFDAISFVHDQPREAN